MSTTELSILQKIITDLAGQQISDLYLRSGSQPIVRRDGELVTLTEEQVVTAEFLETSLGFFITPAERQRLEHERQLTVGFSFLGRLRLRISIFYQQGLPEIVIRFIPAVPKSLPELGLPAVLEKLIQGTQGFLLVAGPYGSGRTTTVASLLQTINHSQARHIVTIEEPIEHLIIGQQSVVDQREVGRDVPSWEEALASLPAEDCDVVVLSRLPTTSVVSAALDLALAGKLVIAITESDSTVKAIEKLVSGALPDQQASLRARLADALLAISVQRLIPRIGGGRVLVSEVLVGTPAVKAIIHEGKDYQLQNILHTSRDEGMVAFDHSLAELVKTGEVIREEALQHTIDKEAFQAYLRRS
jgi:twitching motility protein PilT